MRGKIGALVSLLFIVFANSHAVAADSVVEEAKKEGEVVFYAAINAKNLAKLAGAFEKKYPFIKVKTFRGNNETIISRILTEGRAGAYFVDVAQIDVLNGRSLVEKDYLQPFKSKETDAYPVDLQDPKGFLPCCVYVLTYVIGYNSKLVAKKDIPKSFEDLLDPKWKNNLSLDPDDAEWFRALVSVWGKDRAAKYFRELMQLQPTLRRGHTLTAQLMAAGESAAIVPTFGYTVMELQTRGQPVNVVNAEPVIVGTRNLALAKRAPHPNAGKLLIDYILSVEGQSVIASFGTTIARPGVKQKYPHLVDGVKLYPIKPEMGEDYEEFAKLWYSIVK